MKTGAMQELHQTHILLNCLLNQQDKKQEYKQTLILG